MPSTYFRFESAVEAAPIRSAVLERWLASGDDVRSIADWRRDAVCQLADASMAERMPAPATAALSALSEQPVTPFVRPFVLLATPVHTRASMTSVSLPRSGIVRLQRAESLSLARDFNATIGQGALSLITGSDGTLLCLMDGALQIETRDPESAQGLDLWECQPAGRDAGRLKSIGSEIEMWLYDHAINRARRDRREPEITALWLWGGGPARAQFPSRPFHFLGEDVLFSAWSRAKASDPQTDDTLIRCRDAPGSDAFEAALAAILATPRRQLFLSCGSRCVRVRRMRRWFTFRKARPWWIHFDEVD